MNSLVGVTAYLVIGALIFSAMELPQERDRLRDMKAHAEATSERMVDEIVNRTIEKICLLEDWEQCLSRINILELYNQSYDMVRPSKFLPGADLGFSRLGWGEAWAQKVFKGFLDFF